MLTVGMNFNAAMAVLNSLLKGGLQFPGIHPDAIFQAGDNNRRFI
jgi:hypothetical protein